MISARGTTNPIPLSVAPSPPPSAIRDRESMCVGDPVGSGSLAVLTSNTMDPLFGKPRRLPWRPTRDVTTHPRARWNKWRHVLLLLPHCRLATIAATAWFFSSCIFHHYIRSITFLLPLLFLCFYLPRSPRENAVQDVGCSDEEGAKRYKHWGTNIVRWHWKDRESNLWKKSSPR